MTLTPSNPGSFFHIAERDILSELLADNRSPNTRRAYKADIKDFFKSISDAEFCPQLANEFLRLERFTAIALVLKYKADLIDKGLAEATVNRRLAAIKSLVNYANKVGRCEWALNEVKGERVQSYRDTSGVNISAFRQVLASCDRTSQKGKRDYAILRLLWENVLRRAELSQTDVSDFDPDRRTLKILGKGKGSQKEAVSLSADVVEAIAQWLQTRSHTRSDSPLFTTLDNATAGRRLSGNAIYDLVRSRAESAGLTKVLSPHRCRHSGITAALDATGGDVRRVRKLSRHARIDTLLIYDDNRQNQQGEVTERLSALINYSNDLDT